VASSFDVVLANGAAKLGCLTIRLSFGIKSVNSRELKDRLILNPTGGVMKETWRWGNRAYVYRNFL
jgi:hypothetical protein